MDNKMKEGQRRLIKSLENECEELRGEISRGHVALSEMVRGGVTTEAFFLLSKQVECMEAYSEALDIRLDYYRSCYRDEEYELGILHNFGVTASEGE